MGLFNKLENKDVFDIRSDWHQAIIDGYEMEELCQYMKGDTYLMRLRDISDKQPDEQAKILAEGDRFLLRLAAFFGQDDISTMLLKFLELEDVQALELECARTTDRSECTLIFDHLLLRRKLLSGYCCSLEDMDSAIDREKKILATAVYQKIIHENPELLGEWIAQVLVDPFLLADRFDESLHVLMQYKNHLSSSHWRIILDYLAANIPQCFHTVDPKYNLVRILCHDDIYPNLVHASKNSADILEKHLTPNSPGILRELTESGGRYAHRYQMLPQLLAAIRQEHQRDKCFIEALMDEKDNSPVDYDAFFSNIIEYLIPIVSYPDNLTPDEYRSTLKAHVASLPWFSALIKLLASVECAKDGLTKSMSDIYYYALKDNNTTKLRALFRIHAVISFNLRNRLKESSKRFPQRPSTGVISFSLEKDEWHACREASAMVHDNRLDILSLILDYHNETGEDLPELSNRYAYFLTDDTRSPMLAAILTNNVKAAQMLADNPFCFHTHDLFPQYIAKTAIKSLDAGETKALEVCLASVEYREAIKSDDMSAIINAAVLSKNIAVLKVLVEHSAGYQVSYLAKRLIALADNVSIFDALTESPVFLRYIRKNPDVAILDVHGNIDVDMLSAVLRCKPCRFKCSNQVIVALAEAMPNNEEQVKSLLNEMLSHKKILQNILTDGFLAWKALEDEKHDKARECFLEIVYSASIHHANKFKDYARCLPRFKATLKKVNSYIFCGNTRFNRRDGLLHEAAIHDDVEYIKKDVVPDPEAYGDDEMQLLQTSLDHESQNTFDYLSALPQTKDWDRDDWLCDFIWDALERNQPKIIQILLNNPGWREVFIDDLFRECRYITVWLESVIETENVDFFEVLISDPGVMDYFNEELCEYGPYIIDRPKIHDICKQHGFNFVVDDDALEFDDLCNKEVA